MQSAAITARLSIRPLQLRRKRTKPPSPSRITAKSSCEDTGERQLSGAGLVSDAVATFVATVSVVEAGPVPLRITVAGEKAQVLAAGSPEQAKLTCWLKPNAGVTLTVVVPVSPAVTVTVVGLNPIVKLGVPTLCVRAVDVDPVKLLSPP